MTTMTSPTEVEMMNPHFNIHLSLAEQYQAAGMHFLNRCIKQVSARMMWRGRIPSAKTMHKDTSQEGMRILFSTQFPGYGDTVSQKILLKSLLAFEHSVAQPDSISPATLTVSFLEEEQVFQITEFTILSINADQSNSYVEFEVRVVLTQPTQS